MDFFRYSVDGVDVFVELHLVIDSGLSQNCLYGFF